MGLKCDELKDYDIIDIEAVDDERLEKSESSKIQVTRVYIKSDVDAAITELKQKLEDAKASAYADSVDAGMRERRLKRALWLARAKIAKEMKETENLNNYLQIHENSKWFGIYATRIDTWYYKWDNVERKCLKKAEEYK